MVSFYKKRQWMLHAHLQKKVIWSHAPKHHKMCTVHTQKENELSKCAFLWVRLPMMMVATGNSRISNHVHLSFSCCTFSKILEKHFLKEEYKCNHYCFVIVVKVSVMLKVGALTAEKNECVSLLIISPNSTQRQMPDNGCCKITS